MSKLRILLADDHEMVRAGLKMLVNMQSDMEVVGEAGDGRTAVARAQELRPDVVIMDVSMPQMNGLKATAKLKQLVPSIKILTLTRHTEDSYLQELLRAGASGYVLKQSIASELLQAIRAIASGGNYLDSAITKTVVGRYRRKTAPVGTQASQTLTERETEVLRQIAWGYSNKEIAAQLSISVKTVEAHKANAMKRLDMRSRIDIVRFALLQGWLQET